VFRRSTAPPAIRHRNDGAVRTSLRSISPCGRPGRVRLRVATFNIHHGVGADGRLDLARTADVIAATGATLVGLQEVDRTLSPRSEWIDQAAWLGERLGMDVVHGATIDRAPPDPAVPDGPRGRYGNALLSAHPVRSWQALPLPGSARREARGLVDARVDADGETVRVVVTHLQNRSGRERRQQAAHIVDVLAGDGDRSTPTVLLGDMNAGPDSPEMRALSAVLVDVWAAVGDGPGYTFAAGHPFARIDHVLVTSGLTPVAAEVVDTSASDHRPVVADLDVVGVGDGA
jgi:endonuclease/exonuclease/phosphatase family metal-dependent hydrolase